MVMKAKNSKKQQLALTTALVTLNSYVVPNEILSKIFTATASLFPDMNDNSSSIFLKIDQDQPLAMLFNVVLFGKLLPILKAKQSIISDDLKDWADQMEMKSTAFSPVSGVADSSAWKNVNGYQRFSDSVKLFYVEFDSQEILNGTTKVVINDEVFLTTLKIAQSSGVVSVSFSPLLVVLLQVGVTS
ncbi:hypothetical protein G9A89_019795 [Geosiphon pyriformis]|nr:hypothetical protein G9A89_019795 [Geosiphon pyriformis]